MLGGGRLRELQKMFIASWHFQSDGLPSTRRYPILPTNPLKAQQCYIHTLVFYWEKHCPLANFRFGPFPNLGDPYPRTLRSRLWWRQVGNSVHGRHNDGAVGRDDDVVVLTESKVSDMTSIVDICWQHLLVLFFCTLWFLSISFISSDIHYLLFIYKKNLRSSWIRPTRLKFSFSL